MKLYQINVIIENDQIDFAGIDASTVTSLQRFKPHFQQWASEQIRKGEHAQSVIDAVEYYSEKASDNRFIDILKAITPTPKNILTLSLDDIKTSQQQFDSTYAAPSKRMLKRVQLNNYTTTLVNNPDLKILQIKLPIKTASETSKQYETKREEAAAITADIGRSGKWCITDKQMALDYLEKGPLYLITLRGDQLLCSIPNRSTVSKCELMDVLNKPVKLDDEDTEAILPYIGMIFIFRKNLSESDLDRTLEHLAVDPNDMKMIEIALKTLSLSGVRNEELEEYLIMNAEELLETLPNDLMKYTFDNIGTRWLELEPSLDSLLGSSTYFIKDHSHFYFDYLERFIKGEWPLLDKSLYAHRRRLTSDYELLIRTFEYILNYKNQRFPQIEEQLIKGGRQAIRKQQSQVRANYSDSAVDKAVNLAIAYTKKFNMRPPNDRSWSWID